MRRRRSQVTNNRFGSSRSIGHSDIRTRKKRHERDELPDVGRSEFRKQLAHDWLTRVKANLPGRAILSGSRALVNVPEITDRPLVPDYEFISASVAISAYPISRSSIQHEQTLHDGAPTYGTARLVSVDQLNLKYPNTSGAVLRVLADVGGDITADEIELSR